VDSLVISLPPSTAKRLRREAERNEMSVEEHVLELLGTSLNPR